MYSQSLRLGKILGIPLGVNYSWFIIFFLITVSLTTQFASQRPEWHFTEHLVLGIATSILFFGSVLLHELGHSVMALRYGIPVRAITLFVFGGVAQIGKEPEKPSHEFFIAVAGPVTSALLGISFYGLMFLTRESVEGFSTLSQWLGHINIILAVFNLVPGFPLDGGRILRSILWKSTGSYERATNIASAAGQLFAYAFIFWGIWLALTGRLIDGIWIGFIGWFLLNAAQAANVQVTFRTALKGITAADVMTHECLMLPGYISISELVKTYFLRQGTRCAMVMDGNRFRGLVTLHEIKQIPHDEWDRTTLQAVMVPEHKLHSVEPNTPVVHVLQRMKEENVSQVPVTDGDKLVGVIGRDRLLALIQTHLELKM